MAEEAPDDVTEDVTEDGSEVVTGAVTCCWVHPATKIIDRIASRKRIL